MHESILGGWPGLAFITVEQGLTYFKLGGAKGSVSLWSVVCAHDEAVVGGTPVGPGLSPHLTSCGSCLQGCSFSTPEVWLDSPQAK